MSAEFSFRSDFAKVRTMSVDQRRAKCARCGLPAIEVDAYGERLRGCVGCNYWLSISSGDWRRLPEEDIAALRGMGWRWPRE